MLFMSGNEQNPIIPRGQPATVWTLEFLVSQEISESENPVLAHFVVFDQFGSPNVARRARFTRGAPDAPPW